VKAATLERSAFVIGLSYIGYLVREMTKETDSPRTISTAAASRLAGKRVLIVEDIWAIAKAMQSVLERTGLLVSGPIATAADAKRLLSEQPPQLAVVDVKLRGEVALDLIDCLHDRGVSVVVCSGFISKPPAKAAALVQKPFSGPDLIETLCDVVLRAPENRAHPLHRE
jgi:DNA-binding NtrC family response regulator